MSGVKKSLKHFKQESDVLERMRNTVSNKNAPKHELLKILAECSDSYEGLLSKTVKIINVSDATQKKLHGTMLQVAEQNEIISKQKDEMSILNQTNNRLFSIISHDLYSPLTSLISSMDMIHKFFDKMDKEDIYEYVQKFRRTSKSLHWMLENLLHWVKVQTEGIVPILKEFDLAVLVEKTIDSHSLAAERKSISVINNLPDKILCTSDKEIIGIVLRNILSNAVKYTAAGGKITINMPVGRKFTKISIKDNGVGMKKSQRTDLFKIAKINSEPGTEGEKGTGIGMYISSEFIKILGGKIEVDSSLGNGSEFVVYIPE